VNPLEYRLVTALKLTFCKTIPQLGRCGSQVVKQWLNIQRDLKFEPDAANKMIFANYQYGFRSESLEDAVFAGYV